MNSVYDVSHTPTKAQYTHYSLLWFIHRYILPLQIAIVGGLVLTLIGRFMLQPLVIPGYVLILAAMLSIFACHLIAKLRYTPVHYRYVFTEDAVHISAPDAPVPLPPETAAYTDIMVIEKGHDEIYLLNRNAGAMIIIPTYMVHRDFVREFCSFISQKTGKKVLTPR